jgi:hypothetical protein
MTGQKLFTKPQMRKALTEAGVTDFDIYATGARMEVTINKPNEVARFKKVVKWGGYRTGWGGFVFRATEPHRVGDDDFNSVASRHHY